MRLRTLLPIIWFVSMLCVSNRPATGAPKGKISRNIYRLPYDIDMRIGGSDYVNHGGSMDVFGQSGVCTGDAATSCGTDGDCADAGGECDYVMVAMADGIVCMLIEHYDDCGSSGAFGSFGNTVIILHANGEMSRYLHLKQGSPTAYGIVPGLMVTAGQPIGVEGDVGRTSSSSGGCPRVGSCLEAVPAGTGNCGSHLHWNVIRGTTDEELTPFTCGIPGNIYAPNMTYNAADCGSRTYPAQVTVSGVYDGFGTFEARQATDTITAESLTVRNQASVVLHAKNRVVLLPGVHVEPDGYFRAEIEAPEITAASTWSMPAVCPCTGMVGFCYQWSDPLSPNADGIEMGCPGAPGPDSSKCHGCPGESGGGRCCPCVTSGTCQTSGTAVCPK